MGANKSSVKIIGEGTDLWAQGYFVYDSKKSGSVTVSHLRFGPEPIRSTYLIDDADFVACHQFGLLEKLKVLDYAKTGATFLLNSPFPGAEVWDRLPRPVQEQLIDKRIAFWVIDADAVAREVGMGNRINTIMQPCFFALSGVLPADDALARIKASVEHAYGRRGRAIIERNFAAIDAAIDRLEQVTVPSEATADRSIVSTVPEDAPAFVQKVTALLMAGDGDLLPVSALPIDGTFPTGTAQYEKRAIAKEIPIWDPDICIDCGKCAIVCPHATIRMKVFAPETVAGAPAEFVSKDFRSKDLAGHRLTIQVAPDDCTGCGVCVDVCPAKSKTEVRHKAINMEPVLEHRDVERRRWDYFLSIPPLDRGLLPHDNVKGSQVLEPLFEFSGRVRRLRRDAVHQARHPAVRRPHDRGQRHRLLVDLRRQPAHHAVDGQPRGTRPGVEQLALRGQRRVRLRHASRPRHPTRTGSHRPRPTRARGGRRPGAPCSTTRRRPRTRSRRNAPRSRSCVRASPASTAPPAPTHPTCWRWSATSSARACGSSAATGGPTTSASAASTTSSRRAGT